METMSGPSVTMNPSVFAEHVTELSAGDLSDIVEGKLNPQMAFMSGKLKVSGDMGLALKLGTIL